MNLVEEKIKQALDILKTLDIDLWLTYVRKTSEITDPSLFFLTKHQNLTWETALLLSQEGESIAICGRFDVPNIEDARVYDEIIAYDEDIKGQLLNVLQRIEPDTIAVNYSTNDTAADGLTHGLWIKLTNMLKEIHYDQKLRSSEEILAKLRGRKTSTELDRIKEAIRISQEGHAKLANALHLGMSETDIHEWLSDYSASNNVSFAYPPLIHVGPETTVGHARPQPTVTIQPGCIVHLDYGVFYKGYASDIQRMHYILKEGEAKPPAKVQNAFDTIVKAINQGADKLEPGVKGWKVDQAARNIIVDAGFPEYKHGLGHQIGRNVHDGGCILAPKWERYGKTPLYQVEKGQVFTLEVTVFLEEHGMCGLEEDVLVTQEGCKFLSEQQTDLHLLEP